MLKWFIVGAIAVAIILVGSYGRIPFTEISLATSAKTQATAVAENTPRKPRSEALFQVRKFLEEECSNGDMNNDGSINIQDIISLVNWILADTSYVTYADANGDGQINIIDIILLVNIILH